ncbi:hypothetical protein B0T10DRAFT_466679 [Thelonectria olida]|uniref:Uncharacterized protein n=1 Tax=Thelonectria olida TaxID=1576542 RepID=A0A9P8VPH9_9HYPO|nr:hypothetical protein B0T10DRAFT_466679 [Thelonectria olida]
MQLIKSAIVFASLLTAASAVAVDVCKCSIWHIQFQMADPTEAAADVDAKMKRDLDLETRGPCTRNGCRCHPNTKAGVYCGWCPQVKGAGIGGSWNHVFQCDGSEKGWCCNYGRSAHCASSDALTWCPR